MKKSFILLTTAFLLNASVAKSYPPPLLLDDSASFRIAKSVKLGYGESTYSPAQNKSGRFQHMFVGFAMSGIAKMREREMRGFVYINDVFGRNTGLRSQRPRLHLQMHGKVVRNG